MELPFDENPFGKKSTPTISTSATAVPPPQPTVQINAPTQTQRSRKRNQVTIVDSLKGDNSKKAKNQTGESSTSSIMFSDMIKDNFKEEDTVNWSKRGKTEASFCLKQALGEAFFDGLYLVGSLEAENAKLQKSMTSAKTSSDYYKGLLDGAEKKIEDIQNDHKAELKGIQDEPEKLKAEAKTINEVMTTELESLKAENEVLQGDKVKELSEAYSAGFTAYLQNFLADDPDYNWATHFAPSTHGYMIKFKVDNAAAIEKVNEGLKAMIENELAASANKQEGREEEPQRDKDEDVVVVSPSNTVIS